MNTKKFAIILLLVVVIVIGLFFLLKKQSEKRIQQTETKQSKVEKTNVDFSKLPDKFPANIPVEKGSKITQNYTAASPTAQFQATRTFVTAKSLQENLDLYKKFLTTDGWEIKATTENPDYKMIAGAKDKSNLLVIIDENKGSKIKTVSISFSVKK